MRKRFPTILREKEPSFSEKPVGARPGTERTAGAVTGPGAGPGPPGASSWGSWGGVGSRAGRRWLIPLQPGAGLGRLAARGGRRSGCFREGRSPAPLGAALRSGAAAPESVPAPAQSPSSGACCRLGAQRFGARLVLCPCWGTSPGAPRPPHCPSTSPGMEEGAGRQPGLGVYSFLMLTLLVAADTHLSSESSADRTGLKSVWTERAPSRLQEKRFPRLSQHPALHSLPPLPEAQSSVFHASRSVLRSFSPKTATGLSSGSRVLLPSSRKGTCDFTLGPAWRAQDLLPGSRSCAEPHLHSAFAV